MPTILIFSNKGGSGSKYASILGGKKGKNLLYIGVYTPKKLFRKMEHLEKTTPKTTVF